MNKLSMAVLSLVFFAQVGIAQEQNRPGQTEWEKTLAAAQREGSVVVSALSGELLRQVLLSFEQDYPGIKVKYQSGNLRDLWPVVYREREMGQYLWDVRVGGVDASTYQAKDKGLLDPILPALMLPEVVDDSKWLGGLRSLFGDSEMIATSTSSQIQRNRSRSSPCCQARRQLCGAAKWTCPIHGSESSSNCGP